jgi:hypothetical protein
MRNQNLRNLSIGFFAILSIGGCSTFRFAPPPPTLFTKATYTPEKYAPDLKLYQEAPTLTERTRYRDKIVYSTATEIDRNYSEFKNSFFGEHAAAETSLDIAQIGLSSAGTLAGGQTVNLLAAIATGVAGSRLAFNKNFFKEKAPDLLLSRMDALRAEQWSQIYLKLKSPDNTYSLYEAERDLVAYYEKGSLQAAFQNIIAESGALQEKADTETKNAIEARYGALLGKPAPASERAEVEKLFDEFFNLEPSAREIRAKKIIEEFRKLDPKTLINPGQPNATQTDNVAYLYSLARGEANAELRKSLTAAFKAANQ